MKIKRRSRFDVSARETFSIRVFFKLKSYAGVLRMPMPYQCTEEQWSKHPRHDKYQSRLNADLTLVRQSTCVVGGDWLEDSSDVKETSSLVKTKV